MSEFKTDNLDAWKDTEAFLLESLRAQLTATEARLLELEQEMATARKFDTLRKNRALRKRLAEAELVLQEILAYLDRVGPLGFQLEKLDGQLHKARRYFAAARAEPGGTQE
jgi:hypothetical protein